MMHRSQTQRRHMNAANKKPRILITGARLPAALEIARALAAEGAEVWAADTLHYTPAGFSRYVHGYVRIPSPVLEPSHFRRAIIDAAHRYRIDLVIPVSEEVFFLARMRDELAPGTRVFSPSLPILRELHSKWHILERAKGCGARLPRTTRIPSTQALREALTDMPDGVLKAEFSRGSYGTLFPPHENIEGLSIAANRPWLLQERLAGREISVYAIASEGRLLAATVYEPRYRAGKGASLYFQPVEQLQARRFATAFVDRNGITGQIAFDLIECDDGELALLECNPRATSGVHLFPSDSRWARVFLGEDMAPGNESAAARAAKMAVFALYAPTALRQRKLSALWADIKAARDSCFSLDDPLPALGLQLCALEIAVRSLRWPVAAREAYTFDLEWNGEHE